MSWWGAISVGLLLSAVTTAGYGQEPIDVARRYVETGKAILEDPRYASEDAKPAQREALCALGREIFEPYLFARLALASQWQRFTPTEKREFTTVFETYLCRFYLSRLQERYGGEQVTFLGQQLLSETRAVVKGRVQWQGLEVPVQVRMALREQGWKAYDLVVAGVSAVLLYRAQFAVALLNSSPADLIDSLRQRSEAARSKPAD